MHFPPLNHQQNSFQKQQKVRDDSMTTDLENSTIPGKIEFPEKRKGENWEGVTANNQQL